MIPILVSQRVEIIPEYNERRDSLDQRWYSFLEKCNLLPVPVGNNTQSISTISEQFSPKGILLTGGNDLTNYGGNAPERDFFETTLIDYAKQNNIPVLGVCRGMQLIQHIFGIPLVKITGHTSTTHSIIFQDKPMEVNSYHNWGCFKSTENLKITATSEDGVIKAICHKNKPIMGIMWHPERYKEFKSEDISLFKNFFKS